MASYHISQNELKQRYLHNVQVYLEAPEGDIELFEFEKLALDRLRLLKIFDDVSSQDHIRYSYEWREHVVDNIRTKFPNTFSKLCEKPTDLNDASVEELSARQIDHITHFILRAVYYNDSEFQYWLVNQEADWLRLRYEIQNLEGRELFFKLNCLTYERVNPEETINICHKFTQYSNNEVFYKVHFRQALNLIKKRKVLLYKGYAYVPSFLLVDCIVERFKSFLHQAFLCTKRNMILMNEQQVGIINQISKILNNQTSVITNMGKDSNKQTDVQITLANLNKHARKNFPLCMKHLYDTLKENHHLKYASRYQLGNFLKTIGISLEESLEFWKTEFIYKTTETHFEKNYSYFFKHMYGKVGAMRAYRPSTCQNIINEDINIEEAHGCPFKTWDSYHLTRKLQQCGFSPLCIDGIETEILNRRYEKACAKYFQVLHNQVEGPKIDTPFEYFQQSVTVLKDARPKDISSDEDDDF